MNNNENHTKAALQSRAAQEVIEHGMVAAVKTSTGWVNMPLAQFPHEEKIGERKDDQYDIEFFSVPAGTCVSAYDEATSTIVTAPVYSWSIHRGKEVELVTLDNGKQIVTDNDPRAIYGIAKDASTLTPQRFTPTEALKKEVLVPCMLGSGAPRFLDQDGELSEWTHELDEKIADNTVYRAVPGDYYFDFTTGSTFAADSSNPTFPEGHIIVPIDFEFGQFLGCMAGDGWWDKKDAPSLYTRVQGKRACHLADLSEHNSKFVHSYLEKILSGEPVLYRTVQESKTETNGKFGDSIRHTFSSLNMHIITEALSLLLDGHGDERTAGARNKVLPGWACYAPEDFRFGLICGLISTDGTISVNKHQGKREQLLVSITSISLTLLRSISAVLQSLGIASRIGVSKETIVKNISWILSISTPDFKRAERHMLQMCHVDKLNTLLNTTVAIDSKYNRPTARIVFPVCVSTIARKYVPCPKITKEMRERRSEEDLAKMDATAFYITLSHAAKDGYLTLKTAMKLYDFAVQAKREKCALKTIVDDIVAEFDLKMPMEEGYKDKVPYSREQHSWIKSVLERAIHPDNMTAMERETLDKLRVNLSGYARRGEAKTSTLRAACEYLLYARNENTTSRVLTLLDEPIFQEWITILTGGFTWSKVDTVECTGKVEVGYDLTVPGYETFVNSDGVVLSNTINVHVPASPAAVRETKEKLMPSTFPFSNRNQDSLVPLPKQEQVLGLYTAATAPATPPVDFPSEEAALQAIRSGQIPLSADITIRGKA